MEMIFKGIIASALCLTLACSTGCSLGKDSSSKSSSGYSFSSEKTKYDLNNFSFELSDDFSVTEKKDTKTAGIYEYVFTGGGLDEVCVYSYGLEQCTAEVSFQAMEESIKARNDTSVKDIERDTLDVPGYNAAFVHMTVSRESGETGESYLCLSTEGIQFNVSVVGYDLAKRDSIKALFSEIASTVKYTGTEHLPTEPQSYDCEYFSLSCGPEWYIKDSSKDEETSIKLSYYYAQDMEHYLAPFISISVSPEDEDNTPKKRAEKSYDSKKESNHTSEVERKKEEFLGYEAEKVSYALRMGGANTRHNNYFFSENGYVYIVSIGLNLRDEKSSEAEIQTILDTLTVKKLGEEEIARRQQEREAESIQKIEFCGAGFELGSKFELQRETKASKVFHHKSKSMYIEMLFDDDFDGSLDDYIQRDVDMLGYINDLDKVGVRRVILGNMVHFEMIKYEDKSASEEYGKTMECSIYYHEHNGNIFRFLIGYPEEDEKTAQDLLENMLKTITFE